MEKVINRADALFNRFKTRNPFEIADNLKIAVKFGDFERLKGFYKYICKNRFIAISSGSDAIEQTIICSHELGHDQLHRHQAKTGLMKDYHIFNATDIYECEANYFSSQLLLDTTEFLDYASMQYTYSQIAAELNVHEELAIIKGDILKRQGYPIIVPFTPKARYLGRK